jgi:anti-sigma B factor antagonist
MHRIEVELRAGAAIVVAAGELDAFAAPDLDSSLLEAAAARCVVADLHAVSFLDSTALGVLVRAVRGLTESGAAVRVVLPKGSARRIFEITTLDRVLPLAPTRTAALDELAPGASRR